MAYKIEGYDNVFHIVDQSKTQTTYGAVGADQSGQTMYLFFVTPFPDMVEVL